MALIKDSLNTDFSSDTSYSRIISLSPSISELLYDLDLETKLVGLTSKCDEPKYLREAKTFVADGLEIDYAAIKSLNPDLIFISLDEYPLADIDLLKECADVFIVEVKSINDNFDFINNLGRLFKKRNESSKIVLKIEKQLEDLKHVSKDLLIRKGIYFILNDPWVAVGADTFTNDLLKLLKVDNPFNQLKERYPAVSPANIKLSHTQIVILPSDEPYAFKEEDAIEIAANTHDATIFFVEGKAFTRFGSRLIKSLDYLKLLAVKFKEMN